MLFPAVVWSGSGGLRLRCDAEQEEAIARAGLQSHRNKQTNKDITSLNWYMIVDKE
jgi:hypothetical protein